MPEEENLDVSLSGLSTLVAVVKKLLGEGITVTQLAEKVAKYLAPNDVPALETFIKVLQEAQKLI
jgi:O-succinylbenzoate synthase